MTKKAGTQLVPGTKEFFPPPHPNHPVSTHGSFFLLPVWFALLVLGLSGYIPSSTPLLPVVSRAPLSATTAGDTCRSSSISPANPTELPARMPNIVPVACDRASESAEDPRQKGCYQRKKPRIVTSIAFDPWHPAIQADE